MSKLFKKIIIILAGLLVIGYAGMYFLKQNTKKHSPEETITHSATGADFTVFYNRPYKKGRQIFGGLVPYDQVWRTGANEATTFTTNKDVEVDGSILKAGTYTLWTIPNKKSWKVIFNSKEYSWGVGMNGIAKRDAEFDALTIEVPAHPLLNVVEQFSIYFEDMNEFTTMFMAWDRTVVAIPIKT